MDYTDPSKRCVNQQEYQVKSKRQVTQDFSPEVHLLAGKLVPVVTTHSLEGSRAYRHHTPNPHLGAAQPTQDEGTQVTSNPLESPFVITCGE